MKNIEVSGVCDINLNKAKRFAKNFSKNYFTNIKQLVKETNPDLAIVCTPSHLHYANSKDLLNLSINVLVEKPMCLIPKHIMNLKKISKEKKVSLNVAFQNRLNNSIQILKHNFEKGRLGKLVTASIRVRWCRYQSYYNDNWHGQWEKDGGVINQQAIHHLDAINWIAGPFKKVAGFAGNRLNKLEAEDSCVAIGLLKNGALVTIEATTAARPKDYEASLSLVGEKGFVEIGGIALNEVKTWDFLNKQKTDNSIKKKYSEKVKNGYGFSHARLVNKILKKIKKKDIEPVISADEALKTSFLVHSIYNSIDTNKIVLKSQTKLSRKLGKKN